MKPKLCPGGGRCALWTQTALAASIPLLFAGCGGPQLPAPLGDGDGPGGSLLDDGNTVDPKSTVFLSIEFNTLDFGTNLTERWVEVYGESTAPLTYRVDSDSAWLSGRMDYEGPEHAPVRLFVEVDREGLPVGEYEGTITLSADGIDSVELSVRAAVAPAGSGLLALAPQTLNFGSQSVVAATEIWNAGAGEMAFTVRSTVPWADATVKDGTLGAQRVELPVRVSRGDLYPRRYSGWLEIRTDNGQLGVVNLVMEVTDDPPGGSPPEPPSGGPGGGPEPEPQPNPNPQPQPEPEPEPEPEPDPPAPDPVPAQLEVSHDRLEFGRMEEELVLTVRNAGDGELGYSVVSQSPWIHVTPEAGASTGESDEITVRIDRNRVLYGEYSGSIRVNASNGNLVNVSVGAAGIDGDPIGMDALPHITLYAHPNRFRDPIDPQADPITLRPAIYDTVAPDQVSAAFFAQRLRDAMPTANLGRYFSGVVAVPPGYSTPGEHGINTLFPVWLEVPQESMLRRRDGTFLLIPYGEGPGTLLDLTKPGVRAALIDKWIEVSQPFDHLSIDNVMFRITDLFDDTPYGSQVWFDSVLQVFVEYQEKRRNPPPGVDVKPLVLNCASFIPHGWPELAPHVDGLMTESAFFLITHANDQARVNFVRNEMQTYRNTIDMGKHVYLVQQSLGERSLEIVAAMTCLLRNPGENLYYFGGLPDNTEPYYWWRRLGGPLNDYRWDGTVVSRDFMRGRIEVDVATSSPALRVIIDD